MEKRGKRTTDVVGHCGDLYMRPIIIVVVIVTLQRRRGESTRRGSAHSLTGLAERHLQPAVRLFTKKDKSDQQRHRKRHCGRRRGTAARKTTRNGQCNERMDARRMERRGGGVAGNGHNKA